MRQELVHFIRHSLTKKGLKLDLEKLDAILKYERLKCVAEVQRLISLIKYLAKILNSLSQMFKPTKNLTYKDI